MTINIPVKVITLHPDKADVVELLQKLKAQNVAASIFNAVDGRHDTPPLLADESINQQRALATRFVTLTNGEIGCYLSHLRAIREAYNNGEQRLCLLEDDVDIEPEFGVVLAAATELDESFEFVRLMGLKRHRRKIIRQLGEKHQLVRPIKGICGTQGYVINRRGMEKVLQHGSSLYEPIDKFYDHYWTIDLHAFCVEPHVIWEKESPSSIKKQSRSEGEKSLKNPSRAPLAKLRQSLRRRLYLLLRLGDFYPNSKPKGYLGRTKRMR